jgi:phosphatidylserine/phosphatidylglycerophosphate/cardiolipin synthase-like enzyme
MAVVGGRNIADEYFMASAGANFVDLDTFVIGAILPRLGDLFDLYWNSDRVMPIRAIVQTELSDQQARDDFDRMTAAEDQPITRVTRTAGEAGGGEIIEVVGSTGGTPEPEAPPMT